MAEESKGGGSTAGTASLLLTEGVVEVLQENGTLNAEDARKAVQKAQTQAARLPLALIRRDKVLAILDAMMQRLLRRRRPPSEGSVGRRADESTASE